jgi:hypothetical protein
MLTDLRTGHTSLAGDESPADVARHEAWVAAVRDGHPSVVPVVPFPLQAAGATEVAS